MQYVHTADGLQHGLTGVDLLEPLLDQIVDLPRCLPQSPVTRFYRLPGQVGDVLLHTLGHSRRQRLVPGGLYEQNRDTDRLSVKSCTVLVDTWIYTKGGTPYSSSSLKFCSLLRYQFTRKPSSISAIVYEEEVVQLLTSSMHPVRLVAIGIVVERGLVHQFRWFQDGQLVET